eukprot:Phypoly_transcript_23157.p1 GENE.Phypoly_transcript_23157~~Phypoly_transcript_23157.p1  ORF type:complete len:183 (-),score=48.30 Phypoly_transcript_23157:40-543(-)
MAKKKGGGNARRNNREKANKNAAADAANEGDEEMEDAKDYAIQKELAEKAEKYEGKIQFRNYIPRDPVLRKLRRKKYAVPPIVSEINKQLKEVEAASQTNVISLAPKKPNWDLKRDAAKKLEKLERRTQRAIYELLKEKLESEGQGADNLAAAVEAGTKDMSFENVD